ncbi:MAG: type II toxin-antitoxin system VapC family toxin, partial [Terriglobia bacterium]
RISSEDVQQFFEDLEVLPIRVDTITKNLIRQRVFSLAEQYELTVYDAAYLELAIREGLPLATLDNDMRKASRAAGVSLVESQP